MTAILAIDPGNTQSGYAILKNGNVQVAGVEGNYRLRAMLQEGRLNADVCAIEMMAARGMPVSNDEMETLVWIGRFMEQWHAPNDVMLAYRRDVKLFLCDKPTAKDANVRAALIEIVGKPGTKKNPGPTFGVTSHAWPALAVAVFVQHQLKERNETARTPDRRPAPSGRPRVRL